MKIKKFKDFSFLNYTLLFLSSILFGSVLETEPNKNSLIVNNNNIGLVHEKRLIKVMRNDTNIIYKDVASTIQTDSVNAKLPNDITLYSQQYRFDKLTKNKLLQAHHII